MSLFLHFTALNIFHSALYVISRLWRIYPDYVLRQNCTTRTELRQGLFVNLNGSQAIIQIHFTQRCKKIERRYKDPPRKKRIPVKLTVTTKRSKYLMNTQGRFWKIIRLITTMEKTLRRIPSIYYALRKHPASEQ